MGTEIRCTPPLLKARSSVGISAALLSTFAFRNQVTLRVFDEVRVPERQAEIMKLSTAPASTDHAISRVFQDQHH